MSESNGSFLDRRELLAVGALCAASVVGIAAVKLHAKLQECSAQIKYLQEQNNRFASENSGLTARLFFLDSRDQSGADVTPEEIKSLLEIFKTYDTANRNAIPVSQLQNLFTKLGEPLAPAELESATRELEDNRSGEIRFDTFLAWWKKEHQNLDPNQVQAKFKLTAALSNPSTWDTTRLRTRSVGVFPSNEYRVVFDYTFDDGQHRPISPWHDIPLYATQRRLSDTKGAAAPEFHFICEIPKWTRAKMEIATGEVYNAIKQDVRNGMLRNYLHGDMMFNYGAFPQTWEDPSSISPHTSKPGDNDPIDVMEVGSRQLPTGSVTRVKVLGVLPMIDDGETDWKVIAINTADPLASRLNDIQDIDEHMPGLTHAIREWLRVYKLAEGKPQNTFGMGGRIMGREFAISIVEECHAHWRQLLSRNQREVTK